MDTAKQMQMAFMMEEGGLTDDGTTMDPVSGNEVPPGSMAEEVRDDVPAQLSEGEYVVPADVVRFYGVKFFEDLRSEAKRGLMDMEANGRIGGEPVAMTIDNQTNGDLTPEELAVLQQITGMSVGGMVPQPAQSTNPYMQQQQMYQQPAPVAMGNTGQYNKGGQVLYAAPGIDVSTGTSITNPVTKQEADIDPYTQQFGMQQGSMFSPGYLIDQQLGTNVRTVTLYGPEGEVEVVTLPAQQARYDELIAQGYTTTPVQTTPVLTTTETAVGNDDGEPAGASATPQAVDYSTLSNEELTKSLEQNNIANNIALGLMAVVPAVGVFAKLAASHQKSQITKEMEKRGMVVPEDDSILTNVVEAIKDIVDPNKDTTPPTAPKAPTPPSSTEPSYTPGDGSRLRDTATNAGDAAAAVQEQAAATGQSIAEVGREMAPSTAETQTDVEEATGGQGDQGQGSGWGGMNQGGIVKRPSKKKKKK